MLIHGFPPKWSAVKKLIWLKGAGIIGGASYIWKTVTGTLLHITDALASPMQKCEVTLEPIQDLHGQDAPYPAGGGKNKLGWLNTGSAVTPNNEEISFIKNTSVFTVENNLSASFGVRFPNSCSVTLPAGTYYISTNITNQNVGEGVFVFNTSTSSILARARNEGGGSFTLSEQTTVGLGLNLNASTVAGVYHFQLELGASATPYAPYENICPITGWTGCEVTRTGKNLIQMYGKNGSNIISKNASLKAGTYTLSATGINGNYAIYVRKATTEGSVSGDVIANKASSGDFTFTLSEDTDIAVQWYCPSDSSADLTGKTFQLELGSTATDYEPYQSNLYSVTFPDTVYGGKYEFVSGEGNSNLVKFPLLSSYAWQLDIPYGRRFGFPYGSNPSIKKATNKNGTFIGNVLAPVNIGVNSHDFGTFYISNSWLVINDNNSHFNSLEDFKSWLESEDVYIVYEVADPTEISLTPQPISTLAGENNVWSNGDSVEITYKAQAE